MQHFRFQGEAFGFSVIRFSVFERCIGCIDCIGIIGLDVSRNLQGFRGFYCMSSFGLYLFFLGLRLQDFIVLECLFVLFLFHFSGFWAFIWFSARVDAPQKPKPPRSSQALSSSQKYLLVVFLWF